MEIANETIPTITETNTDVFSNIVSNLSFFG